MGLYPSFLIVSKTKMANAHELLMSAIEFVMKKQRKDIMTKRLSREIPRLEQRLYDLLDDFRYKKNIQIYEPYKRMLSLQIDLLKCIHSKVEIGDLEQKYEEALVDWQKSEVFIKDYKCLGMGQTKELMDILSP
jgi:hypothetical protein